MADVTRPLLPCGLSVPPCLTSGCVWWRCSPLLFAVRHTAARRHGPIPSRRRFAVEQSCTSLSNAPSCRVGSEQAEPGLSAVLAPPCRWPCRFGVLLVLRWRCSLPPIGQRRTRHSAVSTSQRASLLLAHPQAARVLLSNKAVTRFSASEEEAAMARVLVNMFIMVLRPGFIELHGQRCQ